MANPLFFMPTDQNSSGNPNELPTYLVNPSGEIRTEPPQESRGRKPGSETGKKNQKKPIRRGMGVARLERLRIEEEKMNMVAAQGGGETLAASPNATRSPDPGVVLQGFPSYGTGGPNTPRRFLGGGVGSGQIPVYSPWGFVETFSHEPSSILNPQVYNHSNNHCDARFKRQRISEDQNVVRSNCVGFPEYTVFPHILPPDHRSHGFFYDHRIARYSAPPFAPTNQGSVEELGSGNPRNETGDVKEYDFFPVSSVSTSAGDCSPDTSTIDLSLKL